MVVVPSLWPEPLGMVGLEALTYGRPVVGSRVGGIAEWLIDNETGLEVTPGYVGQLADRINLLFEDRELAARLGDGGRKLVEHRFTLSTHVDGLLTTFRKGQANRQGLAATLTSGRGAGERPQRDVS